MIDDKGHITIPGFYDDVLEVSADERAKMAKAPFNLEAYQKSLGIKAVHGEEGFSTNERTGIRPTFDVCGIWGGYTGEGAKQYCLLWPMQNQLPFGSQSKTR